MNNSHVRVVTGSPGLEFDEKINTLVKNGYVLVGPVQGTTLKDYPILIATMIKNDVQS